MVLTSASLYSAQRAPTRYRRPFDVALQSIITFTDNGDAYPGPPLGFVTTRAELCQSVMDKLIAMPHPIKEPPRSSRHRGRLRGTSSQSSFLIPFPDLARPSGQHLSCRITLSITAAARAAALESIARTHLAPLAPPGTRCCSQQCRAFATYM